MYLFDVTVGVHGTPDGFVRDILDGINRLLGATIMTSNEQRISIATTIMTSNELCISIAGVYILVLTYMKIENKLIVLWFRFLLYY